MLPSFPFPLCLSLSCVSFVPFVLEFISVCALLLSFPLLTRSFCPIFRCSQTFSHLSPLYSLILYFLFYCITINGRSCHLEFSYPISIPSVCDVIYSAYFLFLFLEYILICSLTCFISEINRCNRLKNFPDSFIASLPDICPCSCIRIRLIRMWGSSL